MKKKKIGLIPTLAFTAVASVAMLTTHVNADTVKMQYMEAGNNSQATSTIWWRRYWDSQKRYRNAPVERFIWMSPTGERTGYCCENGVSIPDQLRGSDTSSVHETGLYSAGTNWDYYSQKYTAAMHDRINKIMYFGYEYPGHQTTNYFLAAQELIWETQLPRFEKPNELDVFWVNMNYDQLIANNTSDVYKTQRVPVGLGVTERIVDNEKNEIERLIREYDTNPALNNNIGYMGENATFTDVNGVLNKYSVQNGGGLNAKVEGNNLVITNPEAPGKYTVTLKYNDYATVSNNAPVLLRTSDDAQMLGIAGSMGKTATLEVKVQAGRITMHKTDSVTTKAQGGASLAGAKYEVRGEDGTVYDVITTDKTGTAQSKWLKFGTYYLKEVSASKGYKVDHTSYKVVLTPTGTEDAVEVSLDVKENIKLGGVEITKYDNDLNGTIKGAAAGAKVMLVLTDEEGRPVLSDDTVIERNQIYSVDPSTLKYALEVVIDDYGNAKFVDEVNAEAFDDKEHSIPYGYYTVIETKASDKGEGFYLYFNDTKVYRVGNDDNEEVTEETRIYHDHPIPVELSVNKIDKVTGKTVKVPNAEFKLWDVDGDKFISQFSASDNKNIDVFKTNANGKLTLPEVIPAGRYRLYEVGAPVGYELNPEYALPDTEGKSVEEANALLDVNGFELTLNDELLDISDEEKAYSSYKDVVFTYECNIGDKPITAAVDVDKFGELLVDKNDIIVNSVDGETKYNVYIPKYDYVGLEGVTFGLYAKETIRSIDGQGVYHQAGDKLATITTNKDGYGISTEEFYLGKVDNAQNYTELNGKEFGGVFEIREEVVPYGYKKLENIPDIVITNDDVKNFKALVSREYKNDKLDAQLKFVKEYDEIKYNVYPEKFDKTVEFGVYNAEDIVDYKGEVVIKADSLVDVVSCTTKELRETLQTSTDLPEGKYYYQELYVTNPYEIKEDKYEFTVKYDSNEPVKIIWGDTVLDEYENVAELNMLKISSSSQKEIKMIGSEIDNSTLSDEVAALIEKINVANTFEEAIDILNEDNVLRLNGAKFGLFLDEDCTKPLQYKNANGVYENIEVTTDNRGVAQLNKLPYGYYFIKEIEAPKGYKISDQVVGIELTRETSPVRAYTILTDDSEDARLLQKTDIYNSQPIANCEFKIAVKETGNVVMHATTDKGGYANIPLDIFKEGVTYTFTEINAPDVYDLDTRPHEFTAHFDDEGEWDVELQEVSNVRHISKVVLIKTDDEGNRVPNCEFELRCDEIGFVEHGTTDKDGIYVFEEVPYGHYTYTELSAPEKYKIDTTPHEIEINKPYIEISFVNTGDVAVYVLAGVSLVSLFGVGFVAKRKLAK